MIEPQWSYYSFVLFILVSFDIAMVIYGMSIFIAKFVFDYRKRLHNTFQPPNEFIFITLVELLEDSKFSLWKKQEDVISDAARIVFLPSKNTDK